MATTDIENVLRARAEVLAKRRTTVAKEEEKLPISIITVGREAFGIPTMYLSCIIKAPPIASMPNLPPWLRGITQLRGELVGVVDIATWFGLRTPSTGMFLAVVEEKKQKLGLQVDSVAGFRQVGRSDIAETFSEAAMGGHPIWGTTKDVTTILDIPRLFLNPDMVVDPNTPLQARRAP